MASTTTTLSGTITSGQTYLTLTAYTAPTLNFTKPILKIDDELFLITDATNSPTLVVARGYMGTVAAAHKNLAGAVYGVPADMQALKGPIIANTSLTTPAILSPTQQITATGATGTTAATVTASPFGFLMVTGTSGAGINLPYPAVGAAYTIKNGMTGALLIYCISGTINGNNGATGFSLTATGNLMADCFCSALGAWQIAGNT